MPVDFGQSWPQRLQIISGLILFTFVLFHFLNHALGLVSLDLMLSFQEFRQFFTRSILGSIVLGAALLTHMGLVLYRLAMRSTLKLPLWDWLRILLGVSIPILLIPHIANTRGANLLKGTNDDYLYVLANIWPDLSWDQSILLLVVWVHSTIGLHYWLRVNQWYRRAFMPLFAVAIAIPILAIAGFSVAGPAAKEKVIANFVAELQAQAEAQAETAKKAPAPPAPNAYGGDIAKTATAGEGAEAEKSWIDTLTTEMLVDHSQLVFYIFLFSTLSVFGMRVLIRKFGEHVEINYKSVKKLRVPKGPTLLEISRANNIPHASQCGGRARCSTCRVRILTGAEGLAQPGKDEAATLVRIKAAPDVRLACQIRPEKNLDLVQLVWPKTKMQTADANSEEDEGVERNVAVMFIDVRGFTSMSAEKLPYDVVFILNALFEAFGEAIKQEDGWIDKYLGDGLMVIFGRNEGPVPGMRHALAAAAKIDRVLEHVNKTLASELEAPLKIGIGLHAGPLVMGRIGHRESASLTVIGTTVNTAARLEALTKEKGVQMILSQEAAQYAGLEIDEFEAEEVDVRGIPEPVAILCVMHARELT